MEGVLASPIGHATGKENRGFFDFYSWTRQGSKEIDFFGTIFRLLMQKRHCAKGVFYSAVLGSIHQVVVSSKH
jgi:hypothetical protein